MIVILGDKWFRKYEIWEHSQLLGVYDKIESIGNYHDDCENIEICVDWYR